MKESLAVEARRLFNTFCERLNQKQLTLINEENSLKVITRLEVLEDSCPGCKQHLQGYVSDLKRLVSLEEFDTLDLKLYVKMKQQVLTHLLKEHRIVQKHYYLSFFVPLSAMTGLALGLMLERVSLVIFPFIILGIVFSLYLNKRAVMKGLILYNDIKRKGVDL